MLADPAPLSSNTSLPPADWTSFSVRSVLRTAMGPEFCPCQLAFWALYTYST